MSDPTFAERDDHVQEPELREEDQAVDDGEEPEQKQSDDADVFGGSAFGSTSADTRTAIPMGTGNADDTGNATDTGNADDHRFFQDTVTEKLRDRWQSIQIDFVDDPRNAVEQAESLVEQVSTQLAEAVEARRRELHSSWSKDGSTASAAHDDGVPTENLRTALQQYRQVFNQLLAR